MEIGFYTQFSLSPAWELWQSQLTSLKGIVKGTICSSLPWTVPVYIYCPLVTTNGTLFYSLKYSSLDDNSYGHFKYSVHLLRVFPIFFDSSTSMFLEESPAPCNLGSPRWPITILNSSGHGDWFKAEHVAHTWPMKVDTRGLYINYQGGGPLFPGRLLGW